MCAASSIAGPTLAHSYNPRLILNLQTPCRRPEVYVRGSFNRWTHNAQFSPKLMEPTVQGGLGFLKAKQDVSGGRGPGQ